MARIKPEQLTAIVDTREQTPLDLSPLRVERGTLSTGDYSIVGLEDEVSIERKSLGDLLACVGRERERFERELDRLRAYRVRCLVVESSWQEIEQGDWRSKLKPSQVSSSLLRWLETGIPIALVGDHARAGRFVSRLLFLAGRRAHEKLSRLTVETEETK